MKYSLDNVAKIYRGQVNLLEKVVMVCLYMKMVQEAAIWMDEMQRMTALDRDERLSSY